MSVDDTQDPQFMDPTGSVDLAIVPKQKDLGGFTVRRVLPSARQRMVGPFIFFDHMGPAELPPGEGVNVRPHPHIGLATVTYLFQGEIIHRDSLGYLQPIRKRAVNLMVAGSGIAHSERAGDDLHQHAKLHGIQSWIALPGEAEECQPEFLHYTAEQIPEVELGLAKVHVIIGEAFGQRSPVKTYSSTLYLEVEMPAKSRIELAAAWPERAVYVVSGEVDVDGNRCAAGVMMVLRPGAATELAATANSRVMVVGGDPVGKRHIWWNFVSSSKARIDQAKADWKEGRFDKVAGDDEFIPLPDM